MKATHHCLLAGLALTSPFAHADYFQLFDRSGQRFVESARVQVEGRVVYTDRYGRLQLTLPPGQYAGRVDADGVHGTILFRVTGSDHLQTLRVP